MPLIGMHASNKVDGTAVGKVLKSPQKAIVHCKCSRNVRQTSATVTRAANCKYVLYYTQVATLV